MPTSSAGRVGERVDDGPAHLQALDLAGQHAVFDERLGPALDDEILEGGTARVDTAAARAAGSPRPGRSVATVDRPDRAWAG